MSFTPYSSRQKKLQKGGSSHSQGMKRPNRCVSGGCECCNSGGCMSCGNQQNSSLQLQGGSLGSQDVEEGLKDYQHDKNISPDHIYYNATIANVINDPNGLRAPLQVSYREVRSDPLISNPEDWYLSVIRFKIPLDGVPLFFFQNVTFTANAQVTNLSNIVDHFPQQLILQGTFTDGSPIIAGIQNLDGSVADMSGVRTGAFTRINCKDVGGCPPGLIPIVPQTTIASGGLGTLTMSANAIFPPKVPTPVPAQSGLFQFIVDTATGFNEDPIPSLYTLATTYNAITNPLGGPIGAAISGTGIPAGDTISTISTTQITMVTNATITNLFPPGTPVSIQSTPYNLTLKYNGNYYPAMLFPTIPTTADGFYVFVVQEFLNSTNNAFQTAFTALKAANPGFPGTHPPYVYFDPTSQLFGLVAENNAWQTQDAKGGTIYMGSELFRFYQNLLASELNTDLLTGIPFAFPAGYPLIIEYNGIPPASNLFTVVTDPYGGSGYSAINMVEQTSSVCQWSQFEKLLITSGTLPVQYEYLSNNSAGFGGSGPQVASSSNFQAILLDFVIPTSLDRCEAIYNASPYRLVPLSGTTPLSSIDLQVYWQDRLLVNHPLFISENDYAEIKLLFRKKFLRV